MRYGKRHRGQTAFGVVTGNFIGSNPIVTLVVTAHVIPPGCDGVALDWLAKESLSTDLPVGQVTTFKPKIQRAPFCIRWDDSLTAKIQDRQKKKTDA